MVEEVVKSIHWIFVFLFFTQFFFCVQFCVYCICPPASFSVSRNSRQLAHTVHQPISTVFLYSHEMLLKNSGQPVRYVALAIGWFSGLSLALRSPIVRLTRTYRYMHMVLWWWRTWTPLDRSTGHDPTPCIAVRNRVRVMAQA